MARVDDQRIAMVTLLAIEAEFLRHMLWVPIAPKRPGLPVMWQSPGSTSELHEQDEAVRLAKLEWVQLYER